MHLACDTLCMLESNIDVQSEAMDGPSRIALLESQLEQLRRRDAEREAELAARERRIRLLQEALRVLNADRFGASRERLHVAPGQAELFNEAEALVELQSVIGVEADLKATPLREVTPAKTTAGRKALASHLPRVPVIHDIPQSERECACGYVDDGRVAIDTNVAENAIRPFALGRRNWLFCDTVNGAKASANLYSLVQTCRANEIEPYAYLRRLLARLPAAQTVSDIEALLPWKSNIQYHTGD
jgi:predicted Zn-dependent protease